MGSLRRVAVPQMLGHPDQAQPYELEHRFALVRGELFPSLKQTLSVSSPFHLKTRLLLQLGYRDYGNPLYFGIRIDDLRRANFSRAWAATDR
jgi:hypothetical protein